MYIPTTRDAHTIRAYGQMKCKIIKVFSTMVAYINGDRYVNNGRMSTCYNPNGLLGSGRWRWQTHEEFINMVKSNGGTML